MVLMLVLPNRMGYHLEQNVKIYRLIWFLLQREY